MWSEELCLAINDMKLRVSEGAEIGEIERLTTEIDLMVRQQSFRGMELEVCADGRQRLVAGDGFSRAGWIR